MSGRRVLLVEDEEDIRRIATVSLTRLNKWDVTPAASGEQAIQLAAEGTFDVILLDVRMPGMDGTTTLKHLQERGSTAATPVIFLTANTQAQDIARFHQLGIAGVIPKPFDPRSLGAKVAGLLGWTES